MCYLGQDSIPHCYVTCAVFCRIAHRVDERPRSVTDSPKTLDPENVRAVDEAPVETKKIPVAVVSMVIADAEDREKISFNWPDEGAAKVKLRAVAVPDDRYDIPTPARTAAELDTCSTALLKADCRTPLASAMTAPKPFLSTIAPVADIAMRRPCIDVKRLKSLAAITNHSLRASCRFLPRSRCRR